MQKYSGHHVLAEQGGRNGAVPQEKSRHKEWQFLLPDEAVIVVIRADRHNLIYAV